MGYLADMTRDPAEETRQARIQDRARRACSFDFRRGTSITPRDADTNARLAKTTEEADYWRYYAKDLRVRIHAAARQQ